MKIMSMRVTIDSPADLFFWDYNGGETDFRITVRDGKGN